MVIGATMQNRFLLHFRPFLSRCPSACSVSSLQNLEQAVREEVEAKNYVKIPDLFISLESCQNSNPFSFFSSFPHNLQVHIVDEILQSFIPIRPRSKPQLAYSYLLSYSLQSSHPFPLALAVLQRTLRSGCLPVPQTRDLLSSTWLERRCLSQSVSDILLQMQTIGYTPDCRTCNYLLSCLCSVDH
ncbi:hypothetical protein PHAVU_005G098533 [Phaseolus vulgaris]